MHFTFEKNPVGINALIKYCQIYAEVKRICLRVTLSHFIFMLGWKKNIYTRTNKMLYGSMRKPEEENKINVSSLLGPNALCSQYLHA